MIWKRIKQLLWPRSTVPVVLWRIHDFTYPDKNHWAGFDLGDTYVSYFTLRTNGVVKVGDEILVNMRSGRVGRYHIYSVRRDFTGGADYKVTAAAYGYVPKTVEVAMPAPRKTPLLLTDGSGGSKPYSGELSDIPSSIALPTSEFWKVHARDEANHRRPNPMR